FPALRERHARLRLEQRRLAAATGPARGVELASLLQPQEQRIEQRVVLEERVDARERRGKRHQCVSRRIEQLAQSGQPERLVRGISTRQREAAERVLEALLEGAVRELQQVPGGRQRGQEPFEQLEAEVARQQRVAPAREQDQRTRERGWLH